eukprot:SAG31_NODE_838_length_11617_cov_36.512936_11_plen_45_part_00
MASDLAHYAGILEHDLILFGVPSVCFVYVFFLDQKPREGDMRKF